MLLSNDKKDFIESLIGILRDNDKETAISLLEILAASSEELSLKDAYDEAYGSALMQIYAQTEN